MEDDGGNEQAAVTENLESLDVVFEQVEGRMAAQDAQISSLDGKANFSLASATLLTAGVTALQSAFSTAQDAGTPNDFLVFGLSLPPAVVVEVLMIVSLLAYVVVVYAAYQAYRVRNFKAVPKVRTLRDKYLQKPEGETKKAMVDAWVEVFSRNEDLINNKIWWTNVVLFALALEAFLLLLMTTTELAL